MHGAIAIGMQVWIYAGTGESDQNGGERIGGKIDSGPAARAGRPIGLSGPVPEFVK